MEKEMRMRQFFVLILLGVFAFGVLCMTGCGGASCETIQCGSFNEEGIDAKGISIPGCGGCLTSGRGCDSCLWSQSNKISCATIDDGSIVTGSAEKEEKMEFIGCDTRYYDGGCLGCGQSEKACYTGVYSHGSENWGIFVGTSDSGENYIGCTDGCLGCYAEGEPVLGNCLEVIETLEGIE